MPTSWMMDGSSLGRLAKRDFCKTLTATTRSVFLLTALYTDANDPLPSLPCITYSSWKV